MQLNCRPTLFADEPAAIAIARWVTWLGVRLSWRLKNDPSCCVVRVVSF